jgi:ADP-heptose:LPS heptosyltransferase
MTATFRKSRFRLLHYIAYLLWREGVQGTAAQRRRFADRMSRRILQRLGFYVFAENWFYLKLWLGGLAKSAVARRFDHQHRKWLWAISSLGNRDYLQGWVRRHDCPHIVVLGMGSVGDILQITPVLRALRQKFPEAQIALLHRSPAASLVLRNNASVDSIALADFHHFHAIKQAVAALGVADLVVEIQSISYVVSYTRAPAGRRHRLVDERMPEAFFTAAAGARERWQRHPPVFPRRDDKFVWPKEWAGYQYLDVLGQTGNLPIDRHAALDFHIWAEEEAIIGRLLTDRRYVTVQNGVDADIVGWSRVTGQRATKLLPQRTWVEVVRLLCAKGLQVIQLGTPDDEAIEGVTMDLRGKTSLGEAGALLRQALCHVGTEGGLVHLAYAVGKRSVVAFGPTSVEFLGYPANINLVASDCTSCWWTTKDWFIYCPRGLAEPECMGAHRAETIVAAVEQVIAENKI